MSGDNRLSILRPQDLVALDFEFVNLTSALDRPVLIRQDAAADAFVVVTFPPQAIAEEVWDGPVGAPPIRTALAGPSRLVFRIPADKQVPLTLEGLLSWKDWEPVLAPTALPRGTAPAPSISQPGLPAALETAIEFPWRLVVSPDAGGRWRTDNGAAATESQQLWSAVLHGADGGVGGDVRALAALAGPEQSFTTSLTGGDGPLAADMGDRAQIVQLSANFHLPITPDGAFFTPVPIRAKRLELTALGANAELEASWEEYPLINPGPPGYLSLGLRQYQHTAALGRDHFVRTVKVGFLCGTGHRAVVETTVERLPVATGHLVRTPDGALFGAEGYLLRTAQVIVQQPIVDYGPLEPAFAHGGREFPFRSIRITTKSARVEPPTQDGNPPFWLLEPGGRPLMFHAVGADIAGSTVEFSLPLMFVPFEAIGEWDNIRGAFDHPPDPPFTKGRPPVELAGQTWAFAPPGDIVGSTVLKTRSMRYDIELPDFNHGGPAMQAARAPSTYVPCFLPRVVSMVASAPAVDDLLGTSEPQDLVLDQVYLDHGFDPGPNRAQIFVRFVNGLRLALPTQRGGGLASPASTPDALSRSLGPVSAGPPAPNDLQSGKADLSTFKDTKLLGTIPLVDLLADIAFDADAAAAAGTAPSKIQMDDPAFHLNPPRLTTRRLPESVETRFLWKPPLLKEWKFGPFTLGLEGADLLLDATSSMNKRGEAASAVRGRLRNVTLTFADALRATIGTLSFRAESGRKTEVGAEKVELAFLGPLEFVNALRSIIPENGFDDPPFLTVDSQGVVAGYTLGVPSVGVGIFSIQNIAVSAALSIPFTDRPAGIRFSIAERHKPFLVTVSLFGGGGFFAIGVSAKGIEAVEASIEFGGNISLNLGIASGGVFVMAGIYFGMKAGSVELTGYLRCGGYLDVLGLIAISLEFYLAFTYRKKGAGSEVWGQASLTVSVKIAFFSTSVTLSVERRFAGSGGDPSFAQSVSLSAWAGYLQAFA